MSSAPAEGDTAGDRGALHIADPVVEKIASMVAAEVAHVGGAAPGVLGVGAGADRGRRPSVAARVAGDRCRLAVRLSVHYPASVRRTTEAARSRLVDRVGALTGLTVDAVDIDVLGLLAADGPTSDPRESS